MNRVAITAAAVLAICCAGSPAWADWGVTLDIPMYYSFADAHATKPAQGGDKPVIWKNAETTKVDGFIVGLNSPWHVGLAYENYTIHPSLKCDEGCTVVDLNVNFEIFDLVFDFPLDAFNLGFGYGEGDVHTKLEFREIREGSKGADSIKVNPAHETQYFVTLGVPFSRFDLHVTYHVLTVEEPEILNTNRDSSGNGNNSGNDRLKLSGQMLSVGARFNF